MFLLWGKDDLHGGGSPKPKHRNAYTLRIMHRDTITLIGRLWSRTTIDNQRQLIRRFVEHNGRQNVQQDEWMRFLAEEFAVPDPPAGSHYDSIAALQR